MQNMKAEQLEDLLKLRLAVASIGEKAQWWPSQICNPLRLKVLESLFLLSQMLPQENFETAAYYSANQIKKVKALKCELANQLDSRETLKSIADRYGMSLTALKDCFKAVYGKPIHAFQREYKMQTATKLLVTTKLSIAEIAGMVGYENPNKFSAAFKEIIGQSPSEYRKSRN